MANIGDKYIIEIREPGVENDTYYKKTGRHFPQVAELLDAMKEDGET